MSGSATTKSDNGPERMLSKSPGVITASFTDDEETPNTQQFFLPSCERHGSIQRSCFMHVEEHIEDVQDVLRRDPCVSTPDITHADIAAKHTNFRVPEHGLITRGDEDTGERLVGPYTEALADEYRVQSGRMIGHMTGSLPAWGRPVADLLNFYHLNNVKIETGKVTTAIEKETIAMMHHTLFGRGDDFYAEHVQGLSSCLGHPTSGGTVANLEALWVARNHAWALGEKFGLPAVTAAEASATANRVKYDSTQSTPCAGVIVCSTLTHYSISKAVGVLGLGTNNVVTVPTNGQLKMDIRALAATLARLAAARTRVIAIVAIAGTTEAGTFDELRPIAELAKKHRAWLHVDAAWGGGHIFGSKQLLAGVDLADSITIDAHKNLFSTIGFGMVLFKEPTSVGAIEKAAQYIIRHGSADIGRYCLEGTRPAVALQLRASLDALGRDGLRATFDRKLAVAKHFAAAVKAAGDLELVLEPESDIVLFRALPPGWARFEAANPSHLSVLAAARRDALNNWQVEVQTAQKRCGRTFVSRTCIADPHALRESKLESPRKTTAPGAGDAKMVVLRAVINAHVSEADVDALLEDIRTIGVALTLGAKPLPEATTLLEPLGQALLTCPDALAVHTSDGPADGSAGGAGGAVALSYRQLVLEALAVASHLLTSPAGSVVPILAERNVDAYVAIIGTVMRSSAWLLIDPSLPVRRVAHMLTDATPSCEIVVTAGRIGAWSATLPLLDDHPAVVRELTPFLNDLRSETRAGKWAKTSLAPPIPAADGDAADAYMIYTSGSTGLPKAVKISQLQLVDILNAFRERWGGAMTAGKDIAIAQIAWAWDMHVLDMWLPLSQGATVRMLRDEERLDGSLVAAAIADTDAAARRLGGALKWLQGTPTFYQTVLRGGWLGDGGGDLTLISSGEPMPPELARRLLLRANDLVNCYGLTEATIFQSFERLTMPEGSQEDASTDPHASTIKLPDVNCGHACYSYANDEKCKVQLVRVQPGVPLPVRESEGEGDETAEDDTTLLAKAVSRELPLEAVNEPGVVGMICFGGSCLPRHGYHNAPELTATKFVPIPGVEMPPEVASIDETNTDLRAGSLMVSGDLGCWRADGKLQVLGRVDSMVKVLGSRVDLAEVKAALSEHRALVSDAAVLDVKVAAADGKLETKLVGYFVPTASAHAQATATGLVGIADEVELWEEIYDGAYAKKDALGEADDAKHEVGATDAANAEALEGMSAEDLVTNWSAYISSYTGKLWPRSTIEHWVNATVDRVLDRKPRRILEHGCGNGMLATSSNHGSQRGHWTLAEPYGMLAFRMALQPEVEEVWMADLSGEACRYLEQVCNHPHFAHIKHKMKVLHRPADNFTDVPNDYFDVVVLSAMVMYFPSIEYFSDVLRKSSHSLRAGGCVYVGDCRSLEHLQHFHTDVVLHNATDEMSAAELRRDCLKRSAAEKELLVAPDYFYRHAELLPGCYEACTILLRRGYDCPKEHEPGADPRHADAPVEMTRWRYDVWLVKGGGLAEARGVPVVTIKEAPRVRELAFAGKATFDEAIELMKADTTMDGLLIRNVPNARVLTAVACEQLIDDLLADNKDSSVRDVRDAIAKHVQTTLAASNGGVGVCPEALLERTEREGGGAFSLQTMFTPSASSVAVSAAHGTHHAAHLFDVLVYRLDAPCAVRPPRFRTGALHTQIDWGRMQVSPLTSTLRKIELGATQQRTAGPQLPLEAYGNKRKWGDVARELTATLRTSLPSYAVPATLVPVDVLPTLATGKVDKKSLPSARGVLLNAESARRFLPPRAPANETEHALVEVYAQLFLGAKPGAANVRVGADDDFGDLGGNSLSAGRLIGACRERFGVQISMNDVFERRTPAKLALLITSKVSQELLDAPSGAPSPFKPHSSPTMSTERVLSLSSFNSSSNASSVNLITDAAALPATLLPPEANNKLDVFADAHKTLEAFSDFTIPVPAEPAFGKACVGNTNCAVIHLQARVWWPTNPTALALHPLLVDFSPYPLTYMTTSADEATFPALAAKGMTCVRVMARGTDESGGVCAEPYDLGRVHAADLAAALEWLAQTELSSPTHKLNRWQAGYENIILHGFSWSASVALRVAALPDGVRPSALKAACVCMGNDELHESDVFFERHCPLAYNFNWATQFTLFAARPPSDLSNAHVAGESGAAVPGWQERWLERLEAVAHLPAKYMNATRNPSIDPFWRAQSLSQDADPSRNGRLDESSLLAGLGAVSVPVLAAAGGGLGRYSDTVERLVRSRGIGTVGGKALPEVKGLLGPWVHQLPHLSQTGPNVDWIEEVASFVVRHTSAKLPHAPQSSLTYFMSESLPVGPELPSRTPGHFRVVSAEELARASVPSEALRLRAASDGSLQPAGEPTLPKGGLAAADGIGMVPDELVGAASGEWFSWGLSDDAAGDQTPDDALSLTFDLPATASPHAGVEVSGRPVVHAWLKGDAARRALTAPPGGTDCLVARLCVVGSDGVSRLAAVGAASLTLAQPVEEPRTAGSAVSLAALLEVDLHFAAFRVAPGEKLRIALSSSYFPMFLAVGGHGAMELQRVELTLPCLGGRETELPPPNLMHAATAKATLQRLRAPKQERTLLAEEKGVLMKLDDGTVLTEGGLAVASRGELTMRAQPRGRRLRASATFASILSKADEHARLEVAASLVAARGNPRAATVCTTITATANGATMWSKTFEDVVAL